LTSPIRVLFVYKGEGKNNVNPVIDNQISTMNNNCEIIKYPIKTSGIRSYFSWAIKLRKYVLEKNFDIIHAHYSYSGFITLITKNPVICSLMGSDVFHQNKFILFFTKICSKYFWNLTIVKSNQMKKIISNSIVIPNGVNQSIYKPIDRSEAKKNVNFKNDINIIFVACNPNSNVKNLKLAKKAVTLLNDKNIKLHIISNASQNQLVNYYNAADLLLITSLSEGSPNVVKEAMSCNCPIVSTKVGDVNEIIEKIDNCFIANSDPLEISIKINKTIAYERLNIKDKISHLNSVEISKKLYIAYQKVLKN
jgi:teichuronic acid biosynthesis glycosyltransferase TuaC